MIYRIDFPRGCWSDIGLKLPHSRCLSGVHRRVFSPWSSTYRRLVSLGKGVSIVRTYSSPFW